MGRTGNAAYEDGAQYLIQTLDSFGLEVINQRFVYDSTETGAQNPEAYNVCGYRFGLEDPDKWMVLELTSILRLQLTGG